MTRGEAIKELREMKTDPWTDNRQMEALDMAINSLKVDEMYDLAEEHADEFVQKRTGYWIVGSDTDIKGETVYWFTCSNCNSDRGQHTNYCPDCGAKMKNTCEEVRGDTE